MSLELDFLHQAVGGVWRRMPAASGAGARELAGVGIDSRVDLTDRAFFALRGPRHDGHDYLAQAAAAGAALLVVDRPVDLEAPPASAAVIQVDDTLRALQRLAAAHRRALAVKVVAVTGSSGKTTTRRLIDAVLSRRLRGVQAQGSFNNHVGVPLTLLEAGAGDRYLLVEIGMNAPGEIGALADLADPDVGVVVSVGQAHLAGLGSIDAIAGEKAQLLRRVRSGGLCVATADSPALRPHLRELSPLVTFGAGSDADVRLTGRTPRDGGQEIEINGRLRAFLPLPGRHNAVNALAAVVVGRRLGLPDDAIVEGLAEAEPAPMRLAPSLLSGADPARPIALFNDAYNANPESMAAALEAFAELSAGARRRVLVLGDMLELGEAGPRLHRELGERVVELDRAAPLAAAFLVGPLAAEAAEVLRRAWGGDRVHEARELDAARIADAIEPGDAVLLKASRGMALERVAAELSARWRPPLAGVAGRDA